ncbi:MAG TPA: 2-dehydropantoate 2-reductase N-terminal domain-containing protein [Candidatus Limnocylindrales bacterium]
MTISGGTTPTPSGDGAPAGTTLTRRTLVVGAGAVGSLLGALLGSVGHDVTLVRIFEPSSERPLVLIRPDGSRVTIPVHRVTHTTDASAPDLILVAVKMPALSEALAPTLRWPGVPTLTVENGIGAEVIAGEIRPHAPMIAGSLTAPIRVASEDEVQWMGRGGLALAAATDSARSLVRTLLDDFARAGLRVAERPMAAPMKWSKLLTNLIANASGAILDMDAQEIYRNPGLFDIERRQLLETLAVMRGLGSKPVSIPGAPVPWLARCIRLPARLSRPIMVRVVGGARAGKAPSLLLHLRSAPPDAACSEQTEVAWMNGAVVQAGAEVGVATPVNACLAALVEEVARDPQRRAWFRGHPERLVAAVAGAAAGTAASGD